MNEPETRPRSLRLFLAGQTCSIVGDTMLWLAVGVWAKTLTQSNAAAGLVFFCYAAPSVFAPIYGWLADRYSRRMTLLVGNLAGVLIVLPLLAVTSGAQVWVLFAVMVAYGALSGVLGASQSALLVGLAGSAGLSGANSFLRTVREGAKLLGPLAGAGLFALFGPSIVILIDAATFALAFVALLIVREPHHAGTAKLNKKDLMGGFRHLWTSPELRRPVLVLAAAMVAIGLIEASLFAVTEALGRPPAFQGVLVSVQGAGAVAAGSVTSALIRRLGEVRVLVVSFMTFAVAMVLLCSTALPVTLAGAGVLGAAVVWLLVSGTTLVQTRTPQGLQGRTYAAFDLALTLPQTVSIGVGSALVGSLDYRLILAFVAVVLTGCAVYTQLCVRPSPTGLGEKPAFHQRAVRNGSARRDPD